MSLEPQNNQGEYYATEPGGEIGVPQPVKGENELPAGFFVGREEEQTRFRELLREQAGPRRGFLGSLFGATAKRQSKTEEQILSRVVLISGQAGAGKTRLSLRLREISQKEKEFIRRFRASRLDWNEERDRDQRLSSLAPGQPTPADAFLDILYIHFVREDLSGHFEEYKTAVEETRQLARTVSGAELDAVWEFRARALGRCLYSLSSERPLLFFLDNYERVADLDWLLRVALEESGSLVTVIIAAQNELKDYAGVSAAERLLNLQPGQMSHAELLRFFTSEMSRYQKETDGNEEVQPSQASYRSPELIARLSEVTQSLPLAARLAAFLLQTGLTVQDLPVEASDPVSSLVKEFLNGPLGPGHPDRSKLYAFGLLRRPDRGVLSALMDLRQDLLPVSEVLGPLQTRYAFLFEPVREMVLHSEIARSMREWLLEPARRYDEQGIGRLNRRAMGFLNERLENWGQNFPTLQGRVREVKWREWALDKVWHAYWLGQEEGWREALPLFVAALAYKPTLMGEIIGIVNWFSEMGALDEAGVKRLHLLEQTAKGGPEQRKAVLELQTQEAEQHIFRQKMPRFANELNLALEQLL